MESIGKTRVEWLDVLRGVLMIFVILSHSYPAAIYRNFFTPFFLTMFFFISGYTFSFKKDFGSFLKNKSKRLLVPFLILGLSRVVMTQVLLGGDLLERLIGFGLQISCRKDELWFVSCLFSCAIIFYVIVRCVQRLSQPMQERILLGSTFMLLILALIDMCIWKIRFPWELELAGFMVFYMALGYCYRHHENCFFQKVERIKWVIGLSIIYIAGVWVQIEETDIHAEVIPYPFLLVFLSLVAIIPLVMIAKRLCRGKLQKGLTFLGKNTLFYYAYAGIVRVVLYMIFEKIGIQPDSYVTPVVCTALSVVVLAVPAWLVRKYLPWIVGAYSIER